MGDLSKNKQQRQPRRRSERVGSARVRVLKYIDESLMGTKKRRGMNTPLYCRLPAVQLPKTEYVCPMCQERITNPIEAVEDPTSLLPTHFGCVIRKLERIYLTDRSQGRIIYRGQGSFALLEQAKPQQIKIKLLEEQSKSGITMRSTIPYETGERQPWRRDLTNRLLERVLEV